MKSRGRLEDIRTVYWDKDSVVMIDQKALPREERTVVCRDYPEVIAAIDDLTVRGAPAIGVATAMGIALGLLRSPADTLEGLTDAFSAICRAFAQSRPTARNLFWAIERMTRRFEANRALAAGSATPRESRTGRRRKGMEPRQATLFSTREMEPPGGDPFAESWGRTIRQALIEEAIRIGEEDIAVNRRMGAHGQALLADGDRVLTHCNAGALATAGYGTALGVIRAARDAGKKLHVYIDETRPVLQGARLTAWEMVREGIPATLIADNMAGFLMQQGKIDKVIVGADRIAANGDTANKIGTYGLAVLASAHGIPFYVAAPLSTIDTSLPDGAAIPIEERHGDELRRLCGVATAPEGIDVYNPAFDVTPHRLISAIITEAGLAKPPYDEMIKVLCP